MKKIKNIFIILVLFVLMLIPMTLTACGKTDPVDLRQDALYLTIDKSDNPMNNSVNYNCYYLVFTSDTICYFYSETIDANTAKPDVFTAKQRTINNGTKFICNSTIKDNRKLYTYEFEEDGEETKLEVEVLFNSQISFSLSSPEINISSGLYYFDYSD